MCKRTHFCAKARTSEKCASSTISFHQLQTVSRTFLTNVRYFVQRIVFAKTSTKKERAEKSALCIYKDTSSAFSMLERLILEPAVQRFLSADMPVFDIQVQVQTTLKKIRFSLRCSTSKWFPRCSKLPSLKWSSDRDFQIRFGLFGSIQVVRKVAVFPVSCKLALGNVSGPAIYLVRLTT